MPAERKCCRCCQKALNAIEFIENKFSDRVLKFNIELKKDEDMSTKTAYVICKSESEKVATMLKLKDIDFGFGRL